MSQPNEHSDQPTTTPVSRSASSRAFFYLALVAIVVLMVLPTFTAGSAVDWMTDLSGGLAKAKADSKPVLLAFSSAGCTYCRQMESEVIPQPEVLDKIAGFVPIKVDAWKDGEAALRYGVEGLPTYVITKPDGTPVLATSGFQPKDYFLRFLNAGQQAANASDDAAGETSTSTSTQ